MRPVLIDNDAGTDDALAIMLLLSGEEKYGYKVVGITTTHGNTSVDNVCRNILLILDAMNRTDVPVFRGSENSLLGTKEDIFKFHGTDGFGDKSREKPSGVIQKENAIPAINRIAETYSDLTIICLAPLTNLALALKTYPSLKHLIGSLWIMGGNIEGVGNTGRSSSEFNFSLDPEAAHIVLSEVKCPVTMLPWEPTTTSPYSIEWRFRNYGNHHNSCIQLLNSAEEDLYVNEKCWNPCDAFLAAAFINEKVIKETREKKIVVELQGSYTRGQCVLLPNSGRNVRIIYQLDFDVIRDMFLCLHNM